MSLLLDTHAFLWWVADDARLSRRVRNIVGDPKQTVYFSPASAWEISTKHRMGRLAEARQLLADLPGLVTRSGFVELAISTKHAVLAGSLAGAHRDPFDRMIAAQAIAENLEVVTTDVALAGLGARSIW